MSLFFLTLGGVARGTLPLFPFFFPPRHPVYPRVFFLTSRETAWTNTVLFLRLKSDKTESRMLLLSSGPGEDMPEPVFSLAKGGIARGAPSPPFFPCIKEAARQAVPWRISLFLFLGIGSVTTRWPRRREAPFSFLLSLKPEKKVVINQFVPSPSFPPPFHEGN